MKREDTSTSFDDFLNECLKDPDVKAEYDALEPEYSFIEDLIDARREIGLTQKQLSDITGISQADISRVENGNGNPSVRTLEKLAQGVGKKLTLGLR